MDLIIFGNEMPKLSFKLDPTSGYSITCENNYCIKLENGFSNIEKITWRDLLDNMYTCEWEFEGLEKYIPNKLKNDLLKIMDSDIERNFFNMFFDECFYLPKFFPKDIEKVKKFFNETIENTALIPQVWVNWIHYDNKSKIRAQRTKTEPFRIDFLIVEDRRKIIIEIDGESHFAEIGMDSNYGGVGYKVDMEKFTEYLRKDRWLRRQGWEVYRFSVNEVEEMVASKNLSTVLCNEINLLRDDLPF